MKPYYQDSAVTIYHGDCREVVPQLGVVAEAVITDPPYNAGKDYGAHNDAMTPRQYKDWCSEVVAACSFAPAQFWVAPRYQLPLWFSLLPGAHLIVLCRGASGPFRGGWLDGFEIALATGKTTRPISDCWDDIRLKGEGYFFREETYGHPGYTPSGIMRRAIDALTGPGELVVEPFCGTGTTLRAAKDLGRRAIGIELEERYCEIAARRMGQEVLALT